MPIRSGRRPVEVRTPAGSLLLALSLVACAGGTPRQAGDPDPGHRLLNALRPVADVAPAGATVTRRTFDEPVWDSCDGVKSTYGWTDVTVDVGFVPHGVTRATVVKHIADGLDSRGWALDANSSSDGAWYWIRQITPDEQATIQVLSGGGGNSPEWDLQATAPPATHPVRGC